MQVKEQQLELDMEQQTGSKSWKEYCQGCICNLHAEYIMWNARLDEAQDRIKIAMRNTNTLIYTDDTTFMAKNKESPDESEEESEKAG